MVMTIAKITAGDGYTYLTRHTAHGDTDPDEQHDAAAYYTAEGNPPGRGRRVRPGLLPRQISGLDWGYLDARSQLAALAP